MRKGINPFNDCTRRCPEGYGFGQEFDSPHLHQKQIPLDLHGSGGIFVMV